jgi:glycosyltransferase involved in cell wall biosynthesis
VFRRIGIMGQPGDVVKPPNGSVALWTWEIGRRLAHAAEVLVCEPLVGDAPSVDCGEAIRFRGLTARVDCWCQRAHRVFYGCSDCTQEIQILRFPPRVDHWLLRAQRMPWKFYAPSQKYGSSLFFLAYALRAACAFRDHGCDVVHIHTFSQFAPIVRALNPRARIFLHVHDEFLLQLDRELVDRRLAAADVIDGCSQYVTEQVRKCFPRHAARCMTVYNGVDTDEFRPPDEKPEKTDGARIVFVGRMSPEKGLHVLLDAFERVAAVRSDSLLDIIGGEWSFSPEDFALYDDPRVRALRRFSSGDSYLQDLRHRVSGTLCNRVFFRGQLPHNALSTYLREAAISVQPSVWEPFGITVVEAMASGLPVVASRVGGLPEVIEDGSSGILVEPDNANDLATALLVLLDNITLRREMGRAARLRAEQKFSWDDAVRTIKSQYSALGL